jgi:hypothetical protein
MEICPCSNNIELIISVKYGHFSRPKKVREKLQRFVRNYGEISGNLFITQGPGQWQAYTKNFNFTFKRSFNFEQNIA